MDFITLYNKGTGLVARTAAKFAVAACESLCCTDTHLTIDEKHILCGVELSICKQKVSHSYPEFFHARKFEPKYIHSMQNLMKDKCLVDMHVLGAFLIIEKVGGPRMDMAWGRRQADCNKLFENSEVAHELKAHPIWLSAASFNSFDKPHHFVEDFRRMGFDEKEMTALMGAHSFGKIHKYAGDFTPRQFASGFCNSDRTEWADGNFWDKTPDKLDNEYFKLLDSSDAADKYVCCSKHGTKGCRTTPNIQRGDRMEFRTNNTQVPGQGCNHKWCMRSATPWFPSHKDAANWALVSTQETMPQWNEDKYGPARPARFMMLAADWALVQDPSARAAVEDFAQSEEAFHTAFRQAFDKAMRLGYSPKSLQTCSGTHTPSPPPVQNAGQGGCWPKCMGPGFCDGYCGNGNACCQQGVQNDPVECKWATNFTRNLRRYECVPTLMKKGIQPPSGLENQGRPCWDQCQGAGRCEYCGSAGACCREHKFGDPAECHGAIGFVGKNYHECVFVSSVPM
jgi:hypothetical protein